MAVEMFHFEGRQLAFQLLDIVPPWRRADVQTLIFHHGVAVDHYIWSDWLPVLAGHYRILTFDMFGCGDSSATGRQEDWTPAARVDDLFALADHVDATSFHVVGESYGGTIALLAALKSPARLRTLAICNASHKGGSIRSVEAWEEIIDRDGMRAWSEHMMGQRFYLDRLDPAMAHWYRERQATTTGTSVKRILRELVEVEIADSIDAIGHPVLLLHGDSSPFVSVNLMEDLHKRLAHSELHIFGHVKHGLPFSHGAQCAAVLADFLKANAAKSL